MDILLNVHYNAEGVEESPKALLRIDRKGLQTLITRIEGVKILKAQDSSVYSVERWAWTCPVLWFDESYLCDDARYNAIKCPGHVKISKAMANKIQKSYDAGLSLDGEGAQIRTEIEIVVTDDGSVHWTACIKHCDVTLETSIIPLEALKRYAEKA